MGEQGFHGPGPGPIWVACEDRIGCRVGLHSVRGRVKGRWGEASEKGQAIPQGPLYLNYL